MSTDKSEIEIINLILPELKSSAKVAARYKARIDMLEERKERAMQNTYRMGVIGVTSSGKSTLINSLLKEDLLPSSVIPSSSQLVCCCKSDTRKGIIQFENKQPQNLTSQNLTPEIIKRYGEEQSNPCNREKVKQIEIFSPDFPFDKELILVDSPGLDAYGFEGHEQLTLNTLLPSIDFCLFITTCKTNSDNKTKSVLNTIAKYDKPVIIIQNMIDSIKPSLDMYGTIRKTEKEVAEEHKKRIQRIVEESEIQSNVVILQYSAIWARNGQSTHDSTLLNKSGYNHLVSIIKETFYQLRPKTENQRVLFLKQELETIISEAEKDGAEGSVPMGKFEFEDDISEMRNKLTSLYTKIKKYLEDLSNAVTEVLAKDDVSESDISETKRKCACCTSNLSSVQTRVYSEIETLCKKLRIPTIQVFNEQYDFPAPSNSPTIIYTTEISTKKIEKPGLLNEVKRGFGRVFKNDDWGYNNICTTKQYKNVQATKKSICEYLKSAQNMYVQEISRWKQKVNKAIEILETEVEKHRSEFNDRIKESLEAKEYLNVASKLDAIVKNISPSFSNPSPISSEDSSHKEQFVRGDISKLAYDISKLAFVIKDKIHRRIFERIVSQNGSSDNIIIGGDSQCLQYFLKQEIGKVQTNPKNESFIIERQNYRIFYDISNIETISSGSSLYSNVFVLISALQLGNALSQLANYHLNKFIHKTDKLYIVVQDFQEIMNAQVINEAISSLRIIESELGLQTNPIFMILHDNPIYNLAALETQYGKNQGISDEITILNNLQKSSLRFLCTSPSDSQNVISIIKALK